MATATLDNLDTRNKSPIVAAYLRAFHLERAHEDTSPDEPDAQFAWAAMEGASNRAMECGIHSLDHAALAALMTFNAIDSVVDGNCVVRDGVRVIEVEDAKEGFLLARRAMKGILEFAFREGAIDRAEWAPVIKFYGADKV